MIFSPVLLACRWLYGTATGYAGVDTLALGLENYVVLTLGVLFLGHVRRRSMRVLALAGLVE